MPQMGESIAEGTLSRWLKKVGDSVKRDEPIFEISTDKVDAEIPAASAGILAEILVKEGQTVAVQTVVARLETDASAAATIAAPAPGPTNAQAQTPSTAPAGGPPRSQNTPAASVPSHQPAAPRTTPMRSGNGNSLEERLRTKSSPLVRRIAAEHNLDISALQGSGIAGRVTKRTIMAFIHPAARAPTVRPSMHAPMGVETPAVVDSMQGDVVEPM